MWGPSSGKLETKNTSFFVLASCRSCVLHNVLVARSRKNVSQCVLCTYFLALYFMKVYISRKLMWEPSSGKLETKNIFFHSFS